MIYDGDDKILRSICQKIENHLKPSKLRYNVPNIACVDYLYGRILISGIPFRLDVGLSNEEKRYLRNTGHINIATNRRVFKDELGYGYYTEGNTDDVYGRFTTKAQANRELYEYYQELIRRR